MTSARRVHAVAASTIQREAVEWLDPGRVPLGMVTVLAGVGGLGKSTWTCLLASRHDGVTLIATAEDSLGATVRPRLEAAGADLDRVRFLKVQTDDGFEDGIEIPDDLGELERVVAESEARLVVVDPLVAHLPLSIDSHKDQSVRRALAPLHRLAAEFGCAVVVLIHLNKSQGLAPLARLAGSGGFGNAARSVLLLDRDPDDPDGEEGRRRVLANIKNNVAAEAPSLLYEVEPIVLPAAAGQPNVETSRMRLIGESDYNGRAILALASDEDRSALDEAKEFLLAELDPDGQHHLASDIYRDARKIGISDRTLKRARKALGVLTEKAGFGRGWEWSLPKGPSDLAPSDNPGPWPLRETTVSMRDSVANEGHNITEGARVETLAPWSEIEVDSDEVERLAALARANGNTSPPLNAIVTQAAGSAHATDR